MNLITKFLKGLRLFVFAVCAIYILWTILAALVYFLIDPNTSSIELIKSVFEISLWLAVPVLILSLFARDWRLSVFALLPVLFFAVTIGPYLIPRSPEAPANAPQLTVLTFNLKTETDGIADAIRSADADIVALQELSHEGAIAVARLADIYPHQALHPQAVDYEGQGILSRYPIESDTYWEYSNVPDTLGHQRVEIDFDGTLFVIYNTHPWPPLGWESGYNDESHRVVLEDIAERTFAEELPLLLVGDFNMTDAFEEYDLLTGHFTDSYREAGNSAGYTFPNYKFEPFPPMLRLDYVWHSDQFTAIEAEVWPDHGKSDHSPVLVTLALRQ